jgi:hypothetical protein
MREDNEEYDKATGSEDVDWMQLPKVKFLWRVLVRRVMGPIGFYTHKKGKYVDTLEQSLASQQGLGSMIVLLLMLLLLLLPPPPPPPLSQPPRMTVSLLINFMSVLKV